MYQIKQQPEDFIVKEISTIQLETEGKYRYFLMKKRNYNTLEAVQQTAEMLRIPTKRIGYAGNKDKKAVTEQTISIEGIPKERIEQMKMKDIELTYKGSGDSRIYLGDLEGNSFEITVRNIDKKPRAIKKFINYFGEQRFSTNNAEIGRAIVKKDFKKATELTLENKGKNEQKVQEYLSKNPHNYVGALKQLPKKILNIYIHAYQSRLWNKTAEKTQKQNIPLIGFNTPIDKETMQKEKIQPRDFIIKQIPELSAEGGIRKRIIEAKNISISELENDELNPGNKKIKIKFELPKGSYATEYIKQLFNIA